MHGSPGCMKQMVDAYHKVGGNLISVLEIPREQVSSYGVIAPGSADGALPEVTGLVEKPPVADAPSNLIISGHYILQPEDRKSTRLNSSPSCASSMPSTA